MPYVSLTESSAFHNASEAKKAEIKKQFIQTAQRVANKCLLDKDSATIRADRLARRALLFFEKELTETYQDEEKFSNLVKMTINSAEREFTSPYRFCEQLQDILTGKTKENPTH
ncbi:MAG: hypothetical protein K940chlam8_00705 [Chlamydiae bacterium]|nr:hypothetical protein [Chlamydiota bacterium]